MNIKRKKLIIIIVGSFLCLSLVLGLTLGLTLELNTPNPIVSEVKGEPDYTIILSWQKITGARNYYVQYEYSFLYPGDIFSQAVSDNFITIKRIRGQIKFRVKALSSRQNQSSSYSDWIEYNVEGLKLGPLYPFDFIHTEDGWKIDNIFNPVTYVFKGETKTVNFYEFTDNFNNSSILSTEELIGQEPYIFNFPPGEIVCRFRPVNYSHYNGEDFYDPPELYELYDEPASYVTITHTNPE